MLKKMPLRLRLTFLTILLLTICCVGLTLILNLSAFRMVDMIEATSMTPAKSTVEEKIPSPLNDTALSIPTPPSTISQSARKGFRLESIFYMMLIISFGGALTYYISGKALKPVNELSCQMKKRNVLNLSEDIEIPKAKDEISDLTLSFNEMMHKLNEAFLMQQRFSQSAAHELRTPLAVLQTKVEVFKKKKSHTSEEYESLIEVIGNHTNRLIALVKNLLDMTNMEDLELNEEISLKNLVDDVASALSLLSKDKNILINLPSDDRTVLGNYDLLYRAFYNLIENAIKYNNANGQIDISIIFGGEKSVVEISDTGIGIPQDMQQIIFEPFFRVDKSRSRQMGGAGLGLSIVKTIIDKHNGEITVTDNKNGGSCFKIVL
ncbi:HAMP domain-containing histidine kinase [Clostridium estertheticum]|uniref:sensor histidine kinase n=1 Tax=Clostridium estertheticum TaxID=238834 RepID=UPI0013E9652A|nr:HAMP domain-containing sensor histidine kinase [Clostridium estertheticum]MBZ9685667.1 HAMP domain-containing histidine kinase [Clostridium estertheticum]